MEANPVTEAHISLDVPLLPHAKRLIDTWDKNRNIADLDEGISIHRNALEKATEKHQSFPRLLSDLGEALIKRGAHTRDLSNLDEGKEVLLRCISRVPDNHPVARNASRNLGMLYFHMFELTRSDCHLDEAIMGLERSTEGAHDTADAMLCLSYLSVLLSCRCQRTADPSDISRATSKAQQAMSMARGYDCLQSLGYGRIYEYPHVQKTHLNVAETFFNIAESSDNSNLIDTSLRCYNNALLWTRRGDPNAPHILSRLGRALSLRFRHTGHFPDIDGAIRTHQRAAKLSEQNSQRLDLSILVDFGRSLAYRFLHSDNLCDASEAIALLHECLIRTPGPCVDPDVLEGLGMVHFTRFQSTNQAPDIFDAVSSFQQLVKLTPVGHRTLPWRLDQLALALAYRFKEIGDPTDIEEAISTQQKGLDLTRDTEPQYWRLFARLGDLFLMRFESQRKPSDLEAALSILRSAVAKSPTEYALLVLGHAQGLMSKHDLEAVVGGVKAALSPLMERLVDGGSVSSKDIFGRLQQHNAGTREQHARNEESLSTLWKAVERSQEDGGLMEPGKLIILVKVILMRLALSGDYEALRESFILLAIVALCDYARPQDRLTAATHWASLSAAWYPIFCDPSVPIYAFDTAVHMLSLVVGLEQTVQGMYTQLQGASLQSFAAASACRFGRLDKAVEWLEQSRWVVWRQLNTLRTPLDDLRNHDKVLAERLLETSKRLEDTVSSRRHPDLKVPLSERISAEAEARSHLLLAKKRDDLLAEVRRIPLFEDFLKPTPCTKILQFLPTAGPIVIINAYDSRCDAIALLASPTELLNIPLPSLSVQKIKQYRSVLDSQLRSQGLRVRTGALDSKSNLEANHRSIGQYRRKGMEKPGGTVHGVLEALWEEVVKPIFLKLGFLVRTQK